MIDGEAPHPAASLRGAIATRQSLETCSRLPRQLAPFARANQHLDRVPRPISNHPRSEVLPSRRARNAGASPCPSARATTDSAPIRAI
jgi:hypothetical protein